MLLPYPTLPLLSRCWAYLRKEVVLDLFLEATVQPRVVPGSVDVARGGELEAHHAERRLLI